MTTRIAVLAVVGSLSLTGAPAIAMGDVPPPAESIPGDPTALAADAYRRGNSLYDQGKLDDAITAYESAWAHRRSVDIASNLGTAKLAKRAYVDAAAYLSYAIAHLPAGTRPEKVEKLRGQFAEARMMVLGIAVDSAPPGTHIEAGGKVFSDDDLKRPLFFEPGQVTLVISAPGRVTKTLTEKGAAGETINISAALEVPLIPAPAEQAPSRPLWPAFVLGGAALAGIGAGVAFQVSSGAAADDASITRTALQDRGLDCKRGSEQSEACSTLADSLEKKDLHQNLAIGFFVAGGALAVATGGYLLWDTLFGAEVTVVPAASPEGVSATAVGRF